MPAKLSKETEAGFQSAVIGLAKLRGWRVHHARPARTARGWRTAISGNAGFPDLVLVRPGRVVVAELKVGRNRPTAEQHAWLALLASAGVETHIWRPDDWTRIETVLGAA